MIRPVARAFVLVGLSAVTGVFACQAPTAPAVHAPQRLAPGAAAPDEIVPDSTCRSGYSVANARTCL
jgi:hypothetical protein